MKKPSGIISIIIIILTVLWFLSDTLIYSPFDIEAFTESLTYYTGIIAMATMSITMVLSTRPKWLTTAIGGLDKGYRVHKWLGVSALLFSLVHWLWSEIPTWLGWIVDNEEDEESEQALFDFEGFEGFIEAASELAKEFALTFYPLIIVLIAIALIKKIPYHWFAKSHRFLAVLYLGFVFHSVALMNSDYWLAPVGIIISILMIAGVVSAFMVLFNLVGKHRKATGSISAINKYEQSKMLEIIIKVGDKWKGHTAGQFAFLGLDKKEKPHPFTISSAWNENEKAVSFTIKALGDYTNTLTDKLKIGDQVSVEGPYGCFDFEGGNKRQIWIGGGVGVTPFLARMEQLSQAINKQSIDFFYAAKDLDESMKDRMTRMANAADITLHLFTEPDKGRITGEKIRSAIEDWQSASVWFCGPSGLGNAVRKDFIKNGFSSKDFHQELFEMR